MPIRVHEGNAIYLLSMSNVITFMIKTTYKYTKDKILV